MTNKTQRNASARSLALASVAPAAFNSSVSRSAAAAALLAACGKSPNKKLFAAVRLAFVSGAMAGALSRGDNRPVNVQIAAARNLIENYQGHGGTAKLRKGMKGRRSQAQELAYGSARVIFSGICKLAGVKSPEARGGDTTSSRKPRAGGKAQGGKTVVRLVPPKVATAVAANDWLATQASALAAFINKNAKVIEPRASTIVADFNKAIKTLARSAS
jgi:hypothetical protein